MGNTMQPEEEAEEVLTLAELQVVTEVLQAVEVEGSITTLVLELLVAVAKLFLPKRTVLSVLRWRKTMAPSVAGLLKQ
jgi:hypothetical protein